MIRSVAWILLTVAAAGCVSAADPESGRADEQGEASPGFGVIGGACGVLDDELVSPVPELVRSEIFFEQAYTDALRAELSEGARSIIDEGNAGGSSVLSEAFSFDLLSRCERATLLLTENEVAYEGPSKKTDYVAEIAGVPIGVSVARAVVYPFDTPYTAEDAAHLLTRKLSDIVASSAAVVASDRWEKQILSILAYGEAHAEALQEALVDLDAEILADTIVWILTTHGVDDFIYCDGPCN